MPLLVRQDDLSRNALLLHIFEHEPLGIVTIYNDTLITYLHGRAGGWRFSQKYRMEK